MALICIALSLTIHKGHSSKNRLYYTGVFMLNGASGGAQQNLHSVQCRKGKRRRVFHPDLPVYSGHSRAHASSFSQASSAEEHEKKHRPQRAQRHGQQARNYFLVIALSHVDASVQYPMVTGGVMIISTLLCFFGPNKPSRREILSVLIGFAGMLALFLIPV